MCGGAAALLQNDSMVIRVTNGVIAIGYQSVIAVWRVKAESPTMETLAFAHRVPKVKAV